jgi:hypothetical protein
LRKKDNKKNLKIRLVFDRMVCAFFPPYYSYTIPLPNIKTNRTQMKIYSKIVGIILTLAGIASFIAVIIGIIEVYDVEQKVMISLQSIPCIIFLHYMYIHNFGFNLQSEIPKKNYRIILILTLLSLITAIIVPAGYLFSQIKMENSQIKMEKEAKFSQIKMGKEAKEMIDRGKLENLPDFTSTLKTKYEDGEMLYSLQIVTPNKTELDSKYETFIIEFKDKDGFKIISFDLKDIRQLVNKDDIKYGISVNSSTSMRIEKYLKISKWDILWLTEY